VDAARHEAHRVIERDLKVCVRRLEAIEAKFAATGAGSPAVAAEITVVRGALALFARFGASRAG
jgi:hypothetical protein